jgi:hypothetical protein
MTVDGAIHIEFGLFEEPGQESNDRWWCSSLAYVLAVQKGTEFKFRKTSIMPGS